MRRKHLTSLYLSPSIKESKMATLHVQLNSKSTSFYKMTVSSEVMASDSFEPSSPLLSFFIYSQHTGIYSVANLTFRGYPRKPIPWVLSAGLGDPEKVALPEVSNLLSTRQLQSFPACCLELIFLKIHSSRVRVTRCSKACSTWFHQPLLDTLKNLAPSGENHLGSSIHINGETLFNG